MRMKSPFESKGQENVSNIQLISQAEISGAPFLHLVLQLGLRAASLSVCLFLPNGLMQTMMENIIHMI